jgi:hypothetical protein
MPPCHARAGLRVAVACLAILLGSSLSPAALLYDFGNPNADEEQMRFLINRARANPEAEADRFALDNTHPDDIPNHTYDVGEGITLGGVSNQRVYWSRYQGPRQVLAWNRALNVAAYNHVDDMYTFNFFDHYTQASRHGYAVGYAPWDRAYAEGYVNHSAGENIATNNSHGSLDAEETHRGCFTEPQVTGRGHRRNLLHSHWREIGVSYICRAPNLDGWTDFWAAEFGTDAFYYGSGDPWPPVDTVFVTGVVYDDDGDSLYEPGEQKAGVEVLVYEGSTSLKYKALTAAGGGYSVPLLRAGGADVPQGTALRVLMLDRLGHRYIDTGGVVAAGYVMFEDTAVENPDQYAQRFNLGVNGLWDNSIALLSGDANLDHAVNVGDLGIVAGHWGYTWVNWLEGDFSGDGLVNVGDLGMLAGAWGTSSPPSPGYSIPEPAGLALLGCALLPMVARRRRGTTGIPGLPGHGPSARNVA